MNTLLKYLVLTALVLFTLLVKGQNSLTDYLLPTGVVVNPAPATGTLNSGAVIISDPNPPAPGDYVAQNSVYVQPTTGNQTQITVPSSGGQQVHLFIDKSLTPPTNYTNTTTGTNPTSIPSFFNSSLPCYKTSTSYGVTPQGAATYSVPIYAPPGTMGMVPNLSIVYNSMQQNGLLGYGWNLAGLSSISRTGQTIYSSGQEQAITLTSSDVFTYNGNSLIPLTGYTNGADQALYHTEEESFNQIQSVGVYNNNGPDHFIVETKDGLTYEYGNTTDSKLVPVGQASNAQVLTWMIDKISDAYGNYMTFTYNNNNTGEVYIAEIDYTGNVNSSITPYNSITFSYDTKADANITYVAGASLNSTVILSSISVNCEGSFVKQYNFGYAYYDATTILQSITEEGDDYTKLNPIQFAYTSDDATSTNPQTSSITYAPYTPGSIGRKFMVLDMNGDGKEDLISMNVLAPNSNWNTWITSVPYELSTVDWSNYEAILNTSTYTSGSTNNTTTFSSQGTVSLSPSTNLVGDFYPLNSSQAGNMLYKAMDVNGDGKEDLILETQTASDGLPYSADIEIDVYPHISTGNAFTTPLPLKTYHNNGLYTASQPTSNILFLDLNGDKKIDAINYIYDPRSNTGNVFQVWFDMTNPSLSTTPTSANPNFFTAIDGSFDNGYGVFGVWDFTQAFPMNLYGDGRSELVNVRRTNTTDNVTYFYTLEYDQTNTYQVGSNIGTDPTNGQPLVIYIGDGLVLKLDQSGMDYNGSKYSMVGGIPQLNASISKYNLYGDFNGDGISDVLQYNSTPGSTTYGWHIYYGNGNAGYVAGTLLSSELGLSSLPNPFFYANAALYYFAEDINGDGKTDILTFGNDAPLTVYYSKGNSFEPSSNQATGQIDFAHTQVFFGDFNGDGTNDLMYVNTSDNIETPKIVYFYKGAQSRRVSEAVDGYNVKTQFAYQSLSNMPSSTTTAPNTTSSYTQTTAPVYPLMNFRGPTYVTTQLTLPDQAGGTSTTYYSYSDGIQNMQGKGFIGFMGFTASNPDVNYVLNNTFTYNPTYFNLLSSQTNKETYTGVLISADAYGYSDNALGSSGGNRNWVRLDGSIHYDQITGNATIKAYTYDGIVNGETTGNLFEEKTTDNVQTTDVVYNNEPYLTYPQGTTNWWVAAKVQQIDKTVTRLQATGNPYHRMTNYTYDAGGAIKSVTTDQDISYTTGGQSAAVVTTYTIDPNSGAKTDQSVAYTNPNTNDPVTSGASQTIFTHYTYDNNIRFLTQTQYPLSESSSATYDPKWGTPITSTGVDGLTTTYTYDGYGRAASITTPDGIKSTTNYSWYTGGLPLPNDPIDVSGAACYSVLMQKPGNPSLNTYYNVFDKEIRTEKDGFANKLYTVKSYTARGTTNQESNTYELASGTQYSPLLTQIDYNDNNTVKDKVTTDLGGLKGTFKTTLTYNYLLPSNYLVGSTKVTIVTPDGKTETKYMDPSGLLVNEIDNVGNNFQYTYNQNGKLANNQQISPTPASCEGVIYTYDNLANPISLHEANSGTIYYIHNSVGQLLSQTDGNNNTYTYEFDVLGRQTQKMCLTDASGAPYNYSYYNSGGAINKIHIATTPNSTNKDTYLYDNLGRVTSVFENVNTQSFTTTFQYDKYSNITEKVYPGNFGIANIYNANGYLTETDRLDTKASIWKANAMNPFGQYIDYTVGNGIDDNETQKNYDDLGLPAYFFAGPSQNPVQELLFNFDQNTGNLNYRQDGIANEIEQFTYEGNDNMGLDRLTESEVYNPSTFGGPPVVNISYAPNGNITTNSNAGTYIYPTPPVTSPPGPNAVTQVSNAAGNIVQPMQNTSLTAFDKVGSINENNTTLNFSYGPDMQRKETDFHDAGGNLTTRYYSGAYEKTIYPAGNADEVYYINCGGTLVGMYVRQTIGGTSNAHMYYVYTDHLGSILSLTDSTGHTAYQQNFDAWGNYRDPSAWSYITNTTYPYHNPTNLPAWLYRGFTGHEHLTNFGLINMNGRLYDPLLGRMLSPDPMIADGANTQNYNMYSYCLNNPLKYTDPSGMETESPGILTGGNGTTMVDGGAGSGSDGGDGSGNGGTNNSTYSSSYAYYYATNSQGFLTLVGVIETPWANSDSYFTYNSTGNNFSPLSIPSNIAIAAPPTADFNGNETSSNSGVNTNQSNDFIYYTMLSYLENMGDYFSNPNNFAYSMRYGVHVFGLHLEESYNDRHNGLLEGSTHSGNSTYNTSEDYKWGFGAIGIITSGGTLLEAGSLIEAIIPTLSVANNIDNMGGFTDNIQNESTKAFVGFMKIGIDVVSWGNDMYGFGQNGNPYEFIGAIHGTGSFVIWNYEFTNH